MNSKLERLIKWTASITMKTDGKSKNKGNYSNVYRYKREKYGSEFEER